MSSKSPSNTTQTVKNEPPEYIKPYAIDLMNKGSAVAARPYQAYGGQRIAGFSPEQEAGLTGTFNRAQSGNEAMNLGNRNLESMLKGDYLNPESNPFFKGVVDQAMGQTQGRLNTQFNSPGAFGNTAHQEVMARGLGDVANQMYSNNYMNERQNMMGALGMAPQYAQNDYNDLNAMLSAGDARRQLSQDTLNQQYADWLEQQNYPLKQLDILGNTIGMSMGNSGTSTSTGPNPYQPNTTANLLGGGMSLAGLLSAMK